MVIDGYLLNPVHLEPFLEEVVVTFGSFPVGSGCNVRTQDPENFDEEVKSLVTAWRIQKTSEGSDITLTSSCH